LLVLSCYWDFGFVLDLVVFGFWISFGFRVNPC